MHRKFIKSLGLILLLPLLFTSCAKKASNTSVTFSKSSFLVGDLSTSFDGGVLIFGRNKDTNQSFQLGLDPSSPAEIQVELPYGDYDVKAIGWHSGSSPENMIGTKYCSQISTVVDQNETPMNLAMDSATCASLTGVKLYDGDPGNIFEVQACHGVVKVPGLGERDTCEEAPSVARSIRLTYLSVDTEGNLDPSLELASKCIPTGDEYTYNLSGYFNVAQGETGFKTPVKVTAYRGTSCDDTSAISKAVPGPAAMASNNYFLKNKTNDGVSYLIGFDSCQFPGADTSTPFAAAESYVSTSNYNVICSVSQFNEIASHTSKEFIIGKTLDFAGSAPVTSSSTHFSGYIEGDIWLSHTNEPHIIGLSDSLFSSFGSNVADYAAGIEHLNIDVSAVTAGPVIAKQVKYDAELYDIRLNGTMTNSSPSQIPDGTSEGDTCGALFNQTYYNGTGTEAYTNIDFEKIVFNNFTLKCTNLAATTGNYVGALLGAATSGNTENAVNRNIRIDRIEGIVNIEVDSTNTEQVVGSMIGFIENNTTVDSWANRFTFKNSYTQTAPRIIGGLIGQHQSMAATSMGQLQLNDNNIHLDISSDLAYGSIQGAGGLVGKAYNPAQLYVKGSVTTGTINTTLKNAGGLIGHIYFESSNSFNISSSMNNATVTATGSAGGLFGTVSLDQGANIYLSTVTNRGTISGAGGSSSSEGVGGLIGTVTTPNLGGYINLNIASNKGQVTSANGYPTQSAAGSIIGVYNASNISFVGDGSYADISSIYTGGTPTPYYIGLINDISTTNIEANFDLTQTVFSGFTSTSPLSEVFAVYDTTNNYSFNYSSLTNDPFPATLVDHPLYTTSGDAKFDLFLNRFMQFDATGRSVINGSESNPFLIKSKSDLLYVNSPIGAKFSWKLTTNINMNGDFLQLSPDGYEFEGHFDGNGFTISNFVNDYGTLPTLMVNNGIFPHVSYGRIKNLNIKSGNVTFKCDTPAGYNGAGVLIGQLATYGAWDGDGDPQIFNISVSDVNITMPSGHNCGGASPFIGYFNSDNGEDAPIFQNISIVNNTIDAENSSALLGYIYVPAASTFNFKNIETIGNRFINDGALSSNAFYWQSSQTLTTSFTNTLYVGPIDGSDPTDIHTAQTGTRSGDNHYVFRKTGYSGGLDASGAVIVNTTSQDLADIASATFDDYFIHDATAGTVRLNRDYITKEIYD